MNRSTLKFAGLLVALLTCNQAAAWSHASGFGRTYGGGGSWSHSGEYGSASGGGGSWSGETNRGGSASGGDGSWNGTGYRGGTASGGEGSWHGTGAEGGTASGGEGAWHAQGENGATAAGYHADGYGTTAYRPPVYGTTAYHAVPYGTAYYHPPTAVIASSGCYNCGYSEGVNPAAAAAAGVVVGEAAATVADQNASYNAGMVASAPPTMPMGATYASLPPGCGLISFSNTTYYQCGNAWLRPSFGANGVYYTVVPMP
jgi:hypothetical protein